MRIGVYGLGRFGRFWASQLARHHSVYGWNRSGGEPIPGVTAASEEEVLSCRHIYICTAISSLQEVLPRIAAGVKPGTLVLDTCSVKVYPARLMDELLPREVYAVATHPMFGPDSGRRGTAGLPFVYAPVRIPDEGQEEWLASLAPLEMDIQRLTPEEHDREAAYTQGVTHFIGRVLNRMDLAPSRMGTLGYRELLKIIEQTCNDPLQLFYDLQHYNPYTEEMRRRMKEALHDTMELF